MTHKTKKTTPPAPPKATPRTRAHKQDLTVKVKSRLRAGLRGEGVG